eukprot:5183828-Pleurochrysis_carterae.AAC.1
MREECRRRGKRTPARTKGHQMSAEAAALGGASDTRVLAGRARENKTIIIAAISAAMAMMMATTMIMAMRIRGVCEADS